MEETRKGGTKERRKGNAQYIYIALCVTYCYLSRLLSSALSFQHHFVLLAILVYLCCESFSGNSFYLKLYLFHARSFLNLRM